MGLRLCFQRHTDISDHLETAAQTYIPVTYLFHACQMCTVHLCIMRYTPLNMAAAVQANGHVEYLVSSFWKQNYCKKHSSDGTPRCCSCNRLKPEKQPWVALSVGRRLLCPHCSCTAVRSTSEAQPLYDNVSAPSSPSWEGLAAAERPSTNNACQCTPAATAAAGGRSLTFESHIKR